MRNVAGFLPHKTDKATFGGTWRVVLAENEDALAEIGWEPMSVDQGFKAGDNVITINSCTSTDSIFSVGAATAEEILSKLVPRIVDIQLYFFVMAFSGPYVKPQILLSPCVAEAIAKGGYSKENIETHAKKENKETMTALIIEGTQGMQNIDRIIEKKHIACDRSYWPI